MNLFQSLCSPLFAFQGMRGSRSFIFLLSILFLNLFYSGVQSKPYFSIAEAKPVLLPQRPSFAEDGAPPSVKTKQTTEEQTDKESSSKLELKGWKLGLNGYTRLPLMISGGFTGTRRPYLVDDQ